MKLVYVGRLSKGYYIEKKPYKTTKLSGLVPLSKYGLESSYGGRAHVLAKIKDSSLMIVADENFETIDVVIDMDDVANLPIHMLKELVTNKKKSIPGNISRDSIVEIIKKIY